MVLKIHGKKLLRRRGKVTVNSTATVTAKIHCKVTANDFAVLAVSCHEWELKRSESGF